MKFDELGVAARIQDKDNYYALVWDGYASGGKLIKKVNGVITQLGWYGYGHNALLKLEVKGNEIIVSINGQEAGRVTDNDLTWGRAGMISAYMDINGNGGEHASLDNWMMSRCEANS